MLHEALLGKNVKPRDIQQFMTLNPKPIYDKICLVPQPATVGPRHAVQAAFPKSSSEFTTTSLVTVKELRKLL